MPILPLTLPAGALRILCLGAHADDIEIGCAGTVLQVLASHPVSECRWVVLSATDEREHEARASASAVLAAARAEVDVHRFRDGHFPAALSAVKDALETTRDAFAPDVVFTHARDDRHQDHRLVSDVTWQTFRDHLILEYEIPKWDGDLGQPVCYMPLSREIARRKVQHVVTAFPSQRSKPWFNEETLFALLRLRGIECRAPSGYAEAFFGRKLVLDPGAVESA
ncbi:MAG TPA: PIG-L family deacetylase [Gemmatimonadales bacterium]|nr:PIG-L family deacetylase [Gemmatimonadales bacterium]